ncbi:hypothetical protein ACH3XW_31640 [Acanthocheilonema viteae]
MNDDLLDNYNPLYDVHLRQYFAMPHMQRHLRNLGLIDVIRRGKDMDDKQCTKQHHTIVDKMLRNREAELQKYADLQRKLHAAEKIEICRRIRSGTISPSDCHRAKLSRSLSRGRYIKRFRRRRSSASIDDKDLVQRIEAENEEPMYENPSLVYNRLSTNILKYRYLHKLDDETLALYMEQLRRQLSRLERFRQVSFGPFSVARHQNDPQVSWFFRRRSIQKLNQHRSRSSKPQLQRNDMYDNSHDNRSQTKRQRGTENSARLPPISRNTKSGLTVSRTRKSTPIEAKKVVQKTTVTPNGRKSFGVTQKIKSITDSKLTDVQAIISASPKLADKSKMEPDEHRSEGSPLNLYDEEVYSNVTSPESIDLRPEGETVSEKSVSPLNLNQSEMPLDDEKESESNWPEQMIEQPKIEQVKIENEQNSNLPFNLSPETTELELANMEETSLISKRIAPETAENLVSHETPTDSIPNEIDGHEMIPPEKIINESQKLTGNEIETEITLEAEKPILPDDKLPAMSDAEMVIKASELMPTGDNTTFSHTEITDREIISNETECDMNEFVAVNGGILKVSHEGKLKGYDSVAITEICSADLTEEIPAPEKNLEETVKDPNPIDEGLKSSAVFPEECNSADELESAICYTKMDLSNDEQEASQIAKAESAIDQESSRHITEGLSKLPESIPETSVINDESLELPKSEISFKQLEDSVENEQELSKAEHLSERNEIESDMVKKEEMESEEGAFQVEKVPDFSIDEQLKYEEKNISVIDESLEEKIQQLDVGTVGLESISKPGTDDKSESLFTSDTALIEHSYPKIKKNVIESAELQEEKKEEPEPEEWSRAKISKSRAAAEITNNEVEKVNDILQIEPETLELVGSDSITQPLLQYMKSSVDDDVLAEESKTIAQETQSETDEMLIVEKEKLPKAVLLNPENLIIDGLTNNLEPVIIDIQESQPFILTSLKKRESDSHESAVTSKTLDTMFSDANVLAEKDCSTEEKLNKSIDELNSTKVESNSLENTVGLLVSDILRSNITPAESNSDVISEERKEAIEENEALSEVHYAFRELLPSEAAVCENLEKITVMGEFKCDERIPKIVVCSDEAAISNIESMENLVVQSDVETDEQYQMEANAETLHQQNSPREQIRDMEQSDISKNEEMITSGRNYAPEESGRNKPMRGHLNEFLQQYMHEMTQNVTQLTEEGTKTSEASEEDVEKVEVQKIDESQHQISTPECIPEFTDQISMINLSKSESDEVSQKEVENVQSHYNILSSMITADGYTEISDSCDTIKESFTESHPYHTSIMGDSQEAQDNDAMLSGHGLSFEHDDIPSQQIGNDVVKEFSEDTECIRNAERYRQELKLKFENGKIESEIPQTAYNNSFIDNILPKYQLIINGLTLDGQLILSSVNDSMLSSEEKFINYFPQNNYAYETINDKIPLISDKNGNPEWNVYEMQHIPSDVLNKSNICAADVNANISELQETVHMKSIKHEQERKEYHSAVTDEHRLFEQSNTGTEECETINVSREHSIS